MGSRRPIPPSSRTPERPQGQPGLVLAHFGQASLVENENGEVFRCATRRNLPRTVCGDRVFWQASNPREGVILRVLERATTLIRPDKHGRIRPIAANLDQIVVMIACKPSFEYGMLDRYLVAAELIGTVPVVVVNKSDLLDFQSRTKLEQRLAIYEQIGYSLLFISTRTTDGLTAMHEHFKSHTSILVGQSGVGKSSLVQVLLPDLDIRTGALSQFTGLGRHTTTVTTLYHLPEGGALIDSPGVRDFSLSPVAAQQLAWGFREFRPHLGRCRFHNCRHSGEPGCAVQDAARGGAINPRRLETYREVVRAMKRR